MEILDSCENFQESFNSMEEKQDRMEEKLESLEENIKTASLESPELREDLAKMGDKLSSLNLEFQVEKRQSKVQMDNLAFNLVTISSVSDAMIRLINLPGCARVQDPLRVLQLDLRTLRN